MDKKCFSNIVFFIFNNVKECVRLFVVAIFPIIFVIYVTVLPVHQKICHSVSLYLFLIRFFVPVNRIINSLKAKVTII